jgi:CRP-like cAMP-binding protein
MDLLLKTIRNYIPFSSEEETIIRSLFRLQKFKKGHQLLQAGAVCKDIFFIEEGLVRYYAIVDGEEKTSYFNKEGEFVCYYSSFLPQKPSTITIEALEACTVYSISYKNMQLFYDQVRYGDRFGRLGIEEVFMNVSNQVNSLYNDPPEVRYQLFLSRFPDIGQRIPQYYIASYIGVKPQSLSRIRKRLTEKN